MMMTTVLRYRLLILAAASVAGLLLITAMPARAQTVAVMVNGEPITDYDIEQRSKLALLTSHQQANRQEVINELIDEKVKIREAKKFGVDPSASDIDPVSYTHL